MIIRNARSGEAFLSNAVIGARFVLRACIVNFRTSLEDIEALPSIVIRIGREVDAALRLADCHTSFEEEGSSQHVGTPLVGARLLPSIQP